MVTEMAKPSFMKFSTNVRLKKIAFGKVSFQKVRVWEHYKQIKIDKC